MSRFVFAALASINIAGMLSLGWFAATVLFHDGVMVVELAICAVLISVMALTTGGGVALRRGGRNGAALGLMVVTALPTLAVFGFLLYLDSHPIDWR